MACVEGTARPAHSLSTTGQRLLCLCVLCPAGEVRKRTSVEYNVRLFLSVRPAVIMLGRIEGNVCPMTNK